MPCCTKQNRIKCGRPIYLWNIFYQYEVNKFKFVKSVLALATNKIRKISFYPHYYLYLTCLVFSLLLNSRLSYSTILYATVYPILVCRRLWVHPIFLAGVTKNSTSHGLWHSHINTIVWCFFRWRCKSSNLSVNTTTKTNLFHPSGAMLVKAR